jgi:DNA-binding GntR family transcriptional regulator
MEMAHQYLYDSIVSGRIRMGDPIFEVEVASAMNISRSPVREALKRLEAEGLVHSFNSRGSFALQITRQDLEELFELRRLFEVSSLKKEKASPNISREFWEKLEKDIDALGDDSSKDTFYQLDQRLHHTIINCGGNSRMKLFYHRLETQIDIVRRISSQERNHFSRSKQYHLQIVRAILDGNMDEAAIQLGRHIDDVRESTIKVFLFNQGSH